MMREVLATDARSTYDAASGEFDDAALGFWDRYGQRTVERLALPIGGRVLDVCCGTGASALHAARAVGDTGSVIGVDLSESLVRLAQEKAKKQRLSNVDFRVGDMTRLDLPARSFDAVVIVFGIFFAPDMAAQVRALSRLVRPGGVLAVTTWGPRIFAPLYTPFLDAVRAHRPGMAEYRPWDRLTSEEDVASLMREAGLTDVAIAGEAGEEPLERPEAFWTIALGTGLRWFIEQLDPASRDAVHADSLRRARGVPSIETNVVYTVARH